MRCRQVRVLRAGALLLLLASPLLAALGVLVAVDAARPPAVRLVEGSEEVALPDRPLLGGSVVVLGRAERAGVPARDLGCRLVAATGAEQSAARLSHLAVLAADPVQVGGRRLQPLFQVSRWTDGSRVLCTDAAEVAPLAVTEVSTFGTTTWVVAGAALAGAVLFAVVGAVGWLLLRDRPAPTRSQPWCGPPPAG